MSNNTKLQFIITFQPSTIVNNAKKYNKQNQTNNTQKKVRKILFFQKYNNVEYMIANIYLVSLEGKVLKSEVNLGKSLIKTLPSISFGWATKVDHS